MKEKRNFFGELWIKIRDLIRLITKNSLILMKKHENQI